MLLIITHKADFTADFVISKLNKRKIAYRRFNCEDILLEPFKVRFNPVFEYSLLGEKDYKSVWFRRTKAPELRELAVEDRFYIHSELDAFFKNIFHSISAKWLSQPSAVYYAENKFIQLKAAVEAGFTIPDTLITNSKDELKEFYFANNGNIIIKPISNTKIEAKDSLAFIFTNTVSPDVMAEIDRFDLTPSFFQANIEKAYEIRVTVVNNKVFAAAVYSQVDEETKIDWRRKKLKFVKEQLPDEIQKLCISLVQKLNLKFGAIDLIKTPEGKFVFLEINPNGQWAWIESQTGLKISDEIIAFLCD